MFDCPINDAIAAVRETLETLEPEKLAAMDETLALDFGEHFAYQTAQSHAHAAGRISTDTAMVIYRALGEVGSASNGGWARGTDTATKYTVTRVVGMILQQRLAAV